MEQTARNQRQAAGILRPQKPVIQAVEANAVQAVHVLADFIELAGPLLVPQRQSGRGMNFRDALLIVQAVAADQQLRNTVVLSAEPDAFL